MIMVGRFYSNTVASIYLSLSFSHFTVKICPSHTTYPHTLLVIVMREVGGSLSLSINTFTLSVTTRYLAKRNLFIHKIQSLGGEEQN